MVFAQLQVNTLNLTTNDLVYDSVTTLNSQQYYLKSPKVNKNNASGLL